MKRRKTVLELSLWVYLAISLAGLFLLFVPDINKIQVFRAWLICTHVFRCGLAISMCVLLVGINRLRRRKMLEKWRA